ncbi:hypothetical protein VXS03_04890 [Photobacterium sp. S4TG1]|uniref:hypothetical protein n=1 Tax=Photobacterium sp. S4TG1 TaxID=3114587 RepID=UPI002E179FCE|nr:hypothetical protein [Photobacterium sp. S4TG1]
MPHYNVYRQAQAYVAHIVIILVLALMSISFNVQASTTNMLDKSDQVTIKTWLGNKDNIHSTKDSKTLTYAVNQQIILYIEVVTPRWFTGGTRIAPIEIPNVVAKQRNQLAMNFTEKKDGVTWTHQRWEVTLYPQAAGHFLVPSTAVTVHVSRSGSNNVTGVLYTEPQAFSAIIPSGLLSDQSVWVSGRDFSVEQQWSQSNPELKAGDAITRTLIVKGSNTLAMLIPKLIQPLTTTDYQTYPQPNQLSDSQTRGDYFSERKESTVYVLQNGGQVSFPTTHLTWWDTETQTLKTIKLEGQSFHVSHTVSSWLHQYWHWLVALVTAMVALVMIAFKTVAYYKTHPLPAWFIYAKAIKHQQWSQVRVLLYRVLRRHNDQLQLKQYRDTVDWQQDATQFQSASITKKLSLSLWKQVTQSGRYFDFICAKFQPKLIFPQLNKQRTKYKKNKRINTKMK